MSKPPFAHRIKKTFKYTPAIDTDIGIWIKATLKARKAEEAKAKVPKKPTNVQPLRKKEKQAA